VIKARVARHQAGQYRAVPLATHLRYLERDGSGRDGAAGRLFDAQTDDADSRAFAARCEGDRHHFRFIVSPEDASQMSDLQAFTRELMVQAERDLGTRLDWVAVTHHNTDNPHVHILVRGRAGDQADLVISRDYIGRGFRAQAERLVSLELGPRSEQDIASALRREVGAERWTGLDRTLRSYADEGGGVVDLRPGDQAHDDRHLRDVLVGRAQHLERLGVVEAVGPAQWIIASDAEATLRALGERGDIIKTMHRALGRHDRSLGVAEFAIHGDGAPNVVGRLIDRGLQDELAGSAYVVIDGIDGRTHHVRFPSLETTGDAELGAIVEVRPFIGADGQQRLALSVRSDLSLAEQVSASGAIWLDRHLIARDSPPVATVGFGREVREALDQRIAKLAEEGLARRRFHGATFAPGLIDTLRRRELGEAADRLAKESGLPHRPSDAGDQVAGVYRQRVTLASGRFAMIDNGLGFELVPWKPALDPHLGRHVAGMIQPGGAVDWSLGRKRGLGLG
jgi:type IV secretory pathway VirD2 relaxase